MNTAAHALRSFVYGLVCLYVCRGISLDASPSGDDCLMGVALTLATIILSADRGASLARRATP